MALLPVQEALQEFEPKAVTAAIDASQCAYLSGYGRAQSAKMVEDPDVTWFVGNLPDGSCNAICQAQFEKRDAAARIRAILASHREVGHQANWWVGPTSRPSDLGAMLVEQGMIHRIDIQGMAADLRAHVDAPPPRGVTVGRVGDVEQLSDSFEPYRASYGVSPQAAAAWFDYFAAVGFAQDAHLRHYVARCEERPAAKCTLLLAADVAGIFDVATMPELRRRGIGAAVTRAALSDAHALGYRVAVLHATEAGAALYRKLHFRPYTTFSLYVLDGA